MTVVKFKGVERPHEIALVAAIERVIDEIAANNMTPIEVLGVLDLVRQKVFQKQQKD